MASARTIQCVSKSSWIFERFTSSLLKPCEIDWNAISICPNGVPTFLNTVLSVKSLCNLDIGNFSAKYPSIALEKERLPSAFSYNFEIRDKGIGRPTKKDRREIESFKNEIEDDE